MEVDMPILPLQTSIFPDDLFAIPDPAAGVAAEWRVLHTKPRQEKRLAGELVQKEVPFYLPLIGHERRFRGRVMTAQLPLFDGYLFLHSDRDGYHEALATRRVVRGLAVPDQERLWSDLRRVFGLISSGLPVTPEPSLLPGQLVEIASGPLAGLRGRVIRSASRKRFVVEVDFIRRGASVLCDAMTLRPIEEPCEFACGD
jgi:transcription antitermination factor NusG